MDAKIMKKRPGSREQQAEVRNTAKKKGAAGVVQAAP
jgi:hypothetical protein